MNNIEMSQQGVGSSLCQPDEAPLTKGTATKRSTITIRDLDNKNLLLGDTGTYGSSSLCQRDQSPTDHVKKLLADNPHTAKFVDPADGGNPLATVESLAMYLAKRDGKVPSARKVYRWLCGGCGSIDLTAIFPKPLCGWMPLIALAVDNLKEEYKVFGRFVKELDAEFAEEIKTHSLNVKDFNKLAVLWSEKIYTQQGFVPCDYLEKAVGGKTWKFKLMKGLLTKAKWFKVIQKARFVPGSEGRCAQYDYGDRHPENG